MGVRSGTRVKSKGKVKKYLTNEDFCQCFLHIRWIVDLATNQAFLPLSFGCLHRNQKIHNNCPLPLIDLIDSIPHYKRSLLGFFSNSSPTIQIQFVHWTLFPCPLTVLVSWVCAPARAERVKEKWESIWHRIFMGTEDYGRVPAFFFFVNFPPPPQN